MDFRCICWHDGIKRIEPSPEVSNVFPMRPDCQDSFKNFNNFFSIKIHVQLGPYTNFARKCHAIFGTLGCSCTRVW